MRHRMRRIRWHALVVAGVLVAGSGTAYAVTSDKSGGSYRTVAATRGDVEEVLQTSGSVDAAHRADLGFATAGTVARVKIALGDTVKAGQVVATLDTASLDAGVTKAKASLARAVAQLAGDEDAQAEAVSDAASGAHQTKPSGNAPSLATGGEVTSATLAALKGQQAAVTEAQTSATQAIAAAKDALAAQVAACADAYQGAAPSTDDDTQQPDAIDGEDACSAALTEVEARQDDVASAQDTLAKALSALAGTLSKALAASSASGARTTGDSPTSSADSPTSDATGAAGGTVTAARLASDQASIEQARADLVEARQQRRQAVLRSTRSGRLVALDVARGDEVSAGDVVATVVGGTAVTIETTVPESKIDQVRVGQQVRVTTPGESSGADGTVTAIGLVADSSSGTASYPVTVTVEDPTIALPAGSSALLAIVVATAHDVVTVPTSAITRRGSGTSAFVQTWDGTSLSRDAVTIGTVGARTVEVTKGLSAGDRVVLADVDQAITGASDEINDRGGFGRAPVLRLDKAGSGGGPVTFKSGG
jgi:multidrug efflux pump subunit AcrA (membrane-fusion protein)